MLKAGLVERTEKLLEDNDWATARYHGCFDIAAKKKGLLLLKLLTNVDALLESHAASLRAMASSLDGSALLVGEGTRTERLTEGVVYERFEVPTVSFETFEQMIDRETVPHIYRDRGGLYMEIDSTALRAARSRKGLTQRELAEAVGISKKAVWEHEKKQFRMLLEIARRLETILERPLVRNVRLMEQKIKHVDTAPKDRLERAVGMELKRLGFGLDFVAGAPFDVIACERALVLSDVETDRRKMRKRADALNAFIGVVRKPAVVITEGFDENETGGIPVLPRERLHEFEKSSDLIRLARRVRFE